MDLPGRHSKQDSEKAETFPRDLVEPLHFSVAHSITGTVFVFEFVIVFVYVLNFVFDLVECLRLRVAHFTTGTVPPPALQLHFIQCPFPNQIQFS